MKILVFKDFGKLVAVTNDGHRVAAEPPTSKIVDRSNPKLIDALIAHNTRPCKHEFEGRVPRELSIEDIIRAYQAFM